MLILPNHFGKSAAPKATPVAGKTAGKSQGPATSASHRRTQQQPAAAGTRKSTRTRRPPKAHSMYAPYVKLTPIASDDPMEVDQPDGKPESWNQVADISKEATICCIYCHDVGSYIWKCTEPDCGIPVCVSQGPGDHGCVDVAWNPVTGNATVTEETFRCPQCHRAAFEAIKYKVHGYSVRQDYLHRNYFPLLAVFLSWSGFGSPYASNTIQSTLREHFNVDQTRLHITTRALKSGNNRPNAMTPHFDWLAKANYEGNLLIFVNTHSDTETGNLVVSGSATDPESLPIHELLSNYIGDVNLKAATQAIATINSKPGVGPCVRGLIISSCGSTGRVAKSVELLKCLVERDIFDFVLTFAGVYTMDTIVVPALNRFVENVYVYDMKIWNALEESFGEDRHALNQSPVMLSFADIRTGPNNERERVVDTRVLAYSNLKDGRPWGLDMFRCFNKECQASSYNMIFHPHGKQYYGKRWVEAKIKYSCLQCKTTQKGIPCPTWIHGGRSQNYGRVWYRWPLTPEQQRDIGIMP